MSSQTRGSHLIAQIAVEPPSALAEYFIAIAGPIVSLALAVVFLRTVQEPGA
jgi:hypothetical protein